MRLLGSRRWKVVIFHIGTNDGYSIKWLNTYQAHIFINGENAPTLTIIYSQ